MMPMLASTPRNIVVAAEAEVLVLDAAQRQVLATDPLDRLPVAENLDGGLGQPDVGDLPIAYSVGSTMPRDEQARPAALGRRGVHRMFTNGATRCNLLLRRVAVSFEA